MGAFQDHRASALLGRLDCSVANPCARNILPSSEYDLIFFASVIPMMHILDSGYFEDICMTVISSVVGVKLPLQSMQSVLREVLSFARLQVNV